MTSKEYFKLQDNDNRKILILKDGLYRVKCNLVVYRGDGYYTDSHIRVDGTNKASSRNHSMYNNEHWGKHSIDTAIILKQNQVIDVSIVYGTHLGSGAAFNTFQIEKM